MSAGFGITKRQIFSWRGAASSRIVCTAESQVFSYPSFGIEDVISNIFSSCWYGAGALVPFLSVWRWDFLHDLFKCSMVVILPPHPQ